MQRVAVLGLVVVAIASSACSKLTMTPPLASPPSGPKQIWSGTSGGFNITWTTSDIIAAAVPSPSKDALSELGRTVVDFHAITRTQISDCDLTRNAKLQSVVGSIVSIQSSDSMKCANGATGTGLGTIATALDHPKSPLLLSDLFPARELAALQIKAEHLCKPVPKDVLGSFAFSEVHQNTVVVSVTFPPQCGSSQVDLALNIPAKLKAPLQLAALRKQGFLWRDQPAIAKGAVTTIEYHYRTSTD